MTRRAPAGANTAQRRRRKRQDKGPDGRLRQRQRAHDSTGGLRQHQRAHDSTGGLRQRQKGYDEHREVDTTRPRRDECPVRTTRRKHGRHNMTRGQHRDNNDASGLTTKRASERRRQRVNNDASGQANDDKASR